MKIIFIVALLFSGLSWSDTNPVPGMKATYTGIEPEKPSAEIPEELKNVGIEEKIGQKIDLSLLVTNELGQVAPLSTYFKAHRPVILSPVYFSCPGLCNFHLNGLTETLKSVDWSPGSQFEIVAFSFDAREKSDVALLKKQNYLKTYQRAETADGWHFVTAEQKIIDQLTASVGF